MSWLLKQADVVKQTGEMWYKKNRQEYLTGLETLGVLGALTDLVNKRISWKDIVAERLRHMRGKCRIRSDEGTITRRLRGSDCAASFQ